MPTSVQMKATKGGRQTCTAVANSLSERPAVSSTFAAVAASGAAVIGASSLEDMKLVKEKCRGKISVLGNLNGIQMCGWDARRAETEVRKIIDSAACGGGLIISDNHGEIPWQVSEDVLLAISQAVREWGRYPQN